MTILKVSDYNSRVDVKMRFKRKVGFVCVNSTFTHAYFAPLKRTLRQMFDL